jgi:hypothetical protein
MIDTTTAIITITGIAPMTQSRQHDEPKLEGESSGDYDIRTWRSKLNTEMRNGRQTIVIPAHGVQQCIASAAKYSKRQIPGQGKATWTAKFMAGIMMTENPALNIDPATIGNITISANADGVRGSGKRVPRRFPQILSGWETTFPIYILDPIITEDVFREMLELAGMFIGLGQFRPQNGGTNGRFKVSHLEWHDRRRKAA